MKEVKDIRDDQIRIIGGGDKPKTTQRKLWVVIGVAVAVVVALIIIFAQSSDSGDITASNAQDGSVEAAKVEVIETVFEPMTVVPDVESVTIKKLAVRWTLQLRVSPKL